MNKEEQIRQIGEIINSAKSIVVVQADNPDADSLSSALALEEILGDMGKQVHLYCGVEVPVYLQHLSGWDRVVKELPAKFDAVVVVDVGNEILLEQLDLTSQKGMLKTKPTIVIDHHATPSDITWAQVVYSYIAISTTELIFEIADKLDWQLNAQAKDMLAVGILSDSLGLTTESTTAHSLRVLAELVEGGVNLAKLENTRRASMKRAPELVNYKGRLLQRVEYVDNDRIALLTIPWDEIEKYSPLYNPSVLAMDDMRMATGCAIAISFKTYPDGKVTAKIRCNWGYPIGDKLAEHFGGGGHPYASGFKVMDKNFEELKAETIKVASKLLDKLVKESEDAAL